MAITNQRDIVRIVGRINPQRAFGREHFKVQYSNGMTRTMEAKSLRDLKEALDEWGPNAPVADYMN